VQTSGNVWNNTSWKWTHVAVTYDKTSGQANIYINGSLQGSANVGTSPMTTADDFYMGQVPGSANSYSGQLDEISLWDRPLNAADISAIYNAGGAGKCPQ
ncbi:MAG TPA: LamG domain-containing protein, partial [Verrucomicrobiae bacterium]|nr:LamG domain-containing protein [Verrucomicrobiae bacterium]